MRQVKIKGMRFEDDLKESIRILRGNVPVSGFYYGCFSGGKDSVAVKELCRMARVPVFWHYNITTIDPPELVHFIKKFHPDVKMLRPRYGNFFSYALKKGFPTRRNRWCCEKYKEGNNPKGVTLVTGIRGQESPRRAADWSLITFNKKTKEEQINPLFKWDSEDLWNFIRDRNIPYCSLYDEGFKRLGCVGCPMAGLNRIREFERWPKFELKWKRLFEGIWNRRTGTLQWDGRQWFGNKFFRCWEEMFDWWLYDKSLPGKGN